MGGIEPGYFELESIAQLNKTMAEVRELYHSDLDLLGYMFTKADSTVNSRTSLKVLRETFADKVFNTMLSTQEQLWSSVLVFSEHLAEKCSKGVSIDCYQ